MYLKTQALVIYTIKYSETDIILKCYTKKIGLQSYIIKGFFSKKNKHQKTIFFPMSLIEIVATQKKIGLNQIKEAKTLYNYQSIFYDIKKEITCLFLSEILKYCIKEEMPNINLFEYLKKSLIQLDNYKNYTYFPIIFLLKLTHYLGFYPNMSNINRPYFSLEKAVFLEDKPKKYFIEKDLLKDFKKIVTLNTSAPLTFSFSKQNKRDLLQSLVTYFQLHLKTSFEVKSLKIIYEIFDN